MKSSQVEIITIKQIKSANLDCVGTKVNEVKSSWNHYSILFIFSFIPSISFHDSISDCKAITRSNNIHFCSCPHCRKFIWKLYIFWIQNITQPLSSTDWCDPTNDVMHEVVGQKPWQMSAGMKPGRTETNTKKPR